MAKLPKIDPARAAERAMDRFMDDPLAVMVQTDTYLDALTNFAPVMPWEFPLPVPRGLYTRLGLDKMKFEPEQ
jgi:hypothetical protein